MWCLLRQKTLWSWLQALRFWGTYDWNHVGPKRWQSHPWNQKQQNAHLGNNQEHRSRLSDRKKCHIAFAVWCSISVHECKSASSIIRWENIYPNIHILGSCGQVFAIRTEANTPDVNIPFYVWQRRIGERTVLDKTIKNAGNPWAKHLPYLNTRLYVVDIDSFVTSRSYTMAVWWKMNRTDNTG